MAIRSRKICKNCIKYDPVTHKCKVVFWRDADDFNYNHTCGFFEEIKIEKNKETIWERLFKK